MSDNICADHCRNRLGGLVSWMRHTGLSVVKLPSVYHYQTCAFDCVVVFLGCAELEKVETTDQFRLICMGKILPDNKTLAGRPCMRIAPAGIISCHCLHQQRARCPFQIFLHPLMWQYGLRMHPSTKQKVESLLNKKSKAAHQMGAPVALCDAV